MLDRVCIPCNAVKTQQRRLVHSHTMIMSDIESAIDDFINVSTACGEAFFGVKHKA